MRIVSLNVGGVLKPDLCKVISFSKRKGPFFFILLPLHLGGVENPLEDGTPAECDPNSEYWCCSGRKMVF